MKTNKYKKSHLDIKCERQSRMDYSSEQLLTMFPNKKKRNIVRQNLKGKLDIIKELADKGYSQIETAKKLNVSAGGIAHISRSKGIKFFDGRLKGKKKNDKNN